VRATKTGDGWKRSTVGDDLLSNRPARGIRGAVTATMVVLICTVADVTMCPASLLLVSLLVSLLVLAR